MPEPSSNLLPVNEASSPEIDWSIRTMADDLAELKRGGTPHAKIMPGRPSGEPPVAPVPATEANSSTPPPPPPTQIAQPVGQDPSQRPPSPPPRPTGKSAPSGASQGKPPSNLPIAKQGFNFRRFRSLLSFASGIPFGFRRYIIPGGIGIITLLIAALVVIGFQRGQGGTPQSAPTPPPTIEGEVLNETPSVSPRPSPSPTASIVEAPFASDSRETITATAQTLLQVLSTIALKPRPPRTLAELTFPGLSTSDVLRSLALDSLSGASNMATSTSTSTPPALFTYLYTQEERLGTTTHPTRLVAIFTGVPDLASSTHSAIESTLTAVKQNLWLGVHEDVQATLNFQEAVFSGVPVRYINFSQPDLTLDYAFIPQRNLLIVATSREAMLETLKRVMRSQ